MQSYLKSRFFGLIRFTRRVIESFAKHDCAKKGAALAYYALFSIFPLLLFVVYIASFFFPSESSRQTLGIYLDNIFPYGAENLAAIVEQTWQARGSIGITSAVGLLWGGSSIFSVLEMSLNEIWGSSPRSYLRRRAMAVVSVLILVLTFLVSFVIGPITSLMLRGSFLAPQTISILLELGVVTIVSMVLYRIFPNDTVPWGSAFMGAFMAAVLIVVAKWGFRLYTSLVIQRSGLLYGSLAWFLTMALWVYLVAQLFFFGAEFAAEFQRRSEKLKRIQIEKFSA